MAAKGGAKGGKAHGGKGVSLIHGVSKDRRRGWDVSIWVKGKHISKSGFGEDEAAKQAAGSVAAAVFEAIAAAEAARKDPATVIAAAKAALDRH